MDAQGTVRGNLTAATKAIPASRHESDCTAEAQAGVRQEHKRTALWKTR